MAWYLPLGSSAFLITDGRLSFTPERIYSNVREDHDGGLHSNTDLGEYPLPQDYASRPGRTTIIASTEKGKDRLSHSIKRACLRIERVGVPAADQREVLGGFDGMGFCTTGMKVSSGTYTKQTTWSPIPIASHVEVHVGNESRKADYELNVLWGLCVLLFNYPHSGSDIGVAY